MASATTIAARQSYRHYYQALFHQQQGSRQSFVNNLLGYLNLAPQSKLVVPGCFDGSYAHSIAANGYDVTGIDDAAEAIEHARQSENEHLHFYRHDARLPFWINYFEGVVHLFSSFGYYRTQREHDNVVRSLAQSLRLNGRYVMDYTNTHYEEKNMATSEEIRHGNERFLVSSRQDDDAFYRSVEVISNNNVGGRFEDRLFKFSPGDFTDMFAYHGLQVQELFGDYELNSYNINTSPRLILVAKKIRP